MRVIFVLLLLLRIIYSSHAQDNLTPEKYVEQVLTIIEKYSLRRDSIDLKKMRENASTQVASAKSIKDCYPIVQTMLYELNDHHSHFMTKEDTKAWKSTSSTTSRYTEELDPFMGIVLNGDIGYLNMNGFASGDSISLIDYSTKLQTLIKSLDSNRIKGWILDLRQNGGGNCWPMLTGIGPLLGDGICGYFINNNNIASSWFYNEGAAGIQSNEFVKVSGKGYKLMKNNNPIAVLTGANTASSGEVVVTAFRQKENTRSFGEPTAGLSTGNATFELSDGSMLVLTTTVYADRKGNRYGGRIVPDSSVKFSYQEIASDTDQVIKAAIEWIYKY